MQKKAVLREKLCLWIYTLEKKTNSKSESFHLRKVKKGNINLKQQKERNNKNQSTYEWNQRHKMKKVNETKSWLFEKVNKFDNL